MFSTLFRKLRSAVSREVDLMVLVNPIPNGVLVESYVQGGGAKTLDGLRDAAVEEVRDRLARAGEAAREGLPEKSIAEQARARAAAVRAKIVVAEDAARAFFEEWQDAVRRGDDGADAEISERRKATAAELDLLRDREAILRSQADRRESESTAASLASYDVERAILQEECTREHAAALEDLRTAVQTRVVRLLVAIRRMHAVPATTTTDQLHPRLSSPAADPPTAEPPVDPAAEVEVAKSFVHRFHNGDGRPVEREYAVGERMRLRDLPVAGELLAAGNVVRV